MRPPTTIESETSPENNAIPLTIFIIFLHPLKSSSLSITNYFLILTGPSDFHTHRK